MATRRRAVSRSRITTRSSSSNTKNKPQRDELATTTATQASSTITTTTTTTLLTADHNQPCSPSPVENSCKAEDEEVFYSWSTPKAKRFRIPEIENCPPAPKKQRSTSSSSTNGGNNCSLRRSSISFFTPPELTEFFFRVPLVPNMSTTA